MSPPGHPDDVGAFREVAQGLHHALQALGHDSVLTNGLDLDERPTIVLGGNLLTRYAAKRYDSDERCDIEAGLAKLFASEVAMKVAQTALGHVKVRRFRPRESQAVQPVRRISPHPSGATRLPWSRAARRIDNPRPRR